MLILANDDGGLYSALQTVWKRYMNSSSQIDAYFIKGRLDQTEEFVLEQNSLFIKTQEGYSQNDALYVKTLGAFRYFRPTLSKYDFVFRTNLSSFIRLDKYLEFCKTLPKTNTCAGVIESYYDIIYPSGAGFTFSIDLVNKLLDDPPEHYIIDDVTIGKAIRKWDLKIIPTKRIDIIKTLEDAERSILQATDDIFHYRVKTAERGRLERDMMIQNALYDRFYVNRVLAPRILMLIIANDDGDIYSALQESWKRYMNSSAQIDAYFIKGRLDQDEEFILDENTLFIKTREGHLENDAVYVKTMLAFKYFRPILSKYDFIYRTNLSSHIRFDKYLEFCKTLPPTGLCAAVVGMHGTMPFPSGSGYTLSIDLVKRLIDEPVEHHVIDDVTIGAAMNLWGVKIQNTARCDMVNGCSIDDCRNILASPDESVFQYRVRTYDNGRLERERVIHRLLLNRFYPTAPKTTIVTMFFNLSILPDATSSVRDQAFYMKNARGTLQIPAPMVIFCDSNTKGTLQMIRSSLTDAPTIFIEKNITEYDFYKMNIERIRENRRVTPSYNNSRNTPSYYITTMFKMLALKIAKDRADFATSHYAWIDMGCRHILKGPMLKPAMIMLNNPKPKVVVTYISYRNSRELLNMKGFMDGGPCGIAATSYTVERRYVDALYNASMSIFHESLLKGCGHSEETVMTYCYDRYPDLFTLNYGDYYSVLANYVAPTTDFHAIRYFFIEQAMKAGRKDLALEAVKKIMESVENRMLVLAPHELDSLRGF
jgi:hypothetical protein